MVTTGYVAHASQWAYVVNDSAHVQPACPDGEAGFSGPSIVAAAGSVHSRCDTSGGAHEHNGTCTDVDG